MNKLAANSQSSSELISLDELDHAIIDLLREDGRLPYRAIARELGLTEATVRSRVKRLEESGTMRVVAVTDIEAAGYQMLLAIGVQVENRSPSDVAVDLAKIPEIFSVNVVVGTHDVEVLMVAEDLDALNKLLSKLLSTISGIRRLTPSLAMNVLKNQPDWVPFHDQA